jgi:hypothetical protein
MPPVVSQDGVSPGLGSAPTAAAGKSATSGETQEITGNELKWVWTEVRKRVFIKLPFSRSLADALEAIEPIVLDGDRFVCGLTSGNYPLSLQLESDAVRNTIESILRQAAGRPIRFDVIEGTHIESWHAIRDRRNRAQDAIIAISESKPGSASHHIDDVLNQIVSEIRQRVTATKDRLYPQVRAALLLEIAPMLAAAEEMLFADAEGHEARRAMARTLDRIAGFLDVTPMVMALEIERCRMTQNTRPSPPAPPVQAPAPDAATTAPASVPEAVSAPEGVSAEASNPTSESPTERLPEVVPERVADEPAASPS